MHAPSKHNVNRVSLTVPNGFAWWNNCTTSRERWPLQWPNIRNNSHRMSSRNHRTALVHLTNIRFTALFQWGGGTDQLNLEWATTFAAETNCLQKLHKDSAYIRRRLYIGRGRLVKPRLRLHECSLYSLTEHAMQRRVDHKLNSLVHPLTIATTRCTRKRRHATVVTRPTDSKPRRWWWSSVVCPCRWSSAMFGDRPEYRKVSRTAGRRSM